MVEIGCKIIQDLLPLFIQGLICDESIRTINEHLNKCDKCKQVYEALSEDLSMEDSLILMSANFSYSKLQKKIISIIYSMIGITLIVGILMGVSTVLLCK